MKRWQQPARALPVTLRPLGGETVNSYTWRLAEANGLVPTAILQTLGQLTEGSGHYLLDRDAWLNDQALTRLETISAIPRPRLLRALPALRLGPPSARLAPLPADLPALHCYPPRPHAWPACRACTLRVSLGTTPLALVRPPAAPMLCRRHQRWLGTADEPAQTDISAVPEILTAHRRHHRLRARSGDPEWVTANVHTAWHITRHWAQEPRHRPWLRARWQARASRLGLAPELSQPVITFPEAVALAEILTDLDWRRHLAMVPAWQADRFYRRIARRLGEPSYQAPSRRDPIRAWTEQHRSRFEDIRDTFWNRPQLATASPVPFPGKGQFR